MTRVLVAMAAPAAERVASVLARTGFEISSVLRPHTLLHGRPGTVPAPDRGEAMDGADVLVLAVDRSVLTDELVSACDRRGVRIVPVTASPPESPHGTAAARLAASFGLIAPVLADDDWAIVDAVHGGPTAAGDAVAGAPKPWTVPAEWTLGVPERTVATSEPSLTAVEASPPPAWRGAAGPTEERPAGEQPLERGAVIVVWGPGGAPGRSTIAALLASELARGGRHVALIDADSHAPSLALALGLADEGPGFAAACRQAAQGTLDGRELTRISQPLAHAEGSLDVLCGVNRPGRWPELAESRVTAALDACRDWADYTVVDVAAPLERDEELMSDLDGPRRNAATLAALRAADAVVCVCAADPLGVSRFLRSHAELRAIVGRTPVILAANRLRPGGLGLDARGQVRRALERFAGIPDVAFLPLDSAATDAAMLQARPVADVSPRSPLVAAVRRLVGEALLPALRGAAASERSSSGSANDPRAAPVVVHRGPSPRARRPRGVGRRRRTA